MLHASESSYHTKYTFCPPIRSGLPAGAIDNHLKKIGESHNRNPLFVNHAKQNHKKNKKHEKQNISYAQMDSRIKSSSIQCDNPVSY